MTEEKDEMDDINTLLAGRVDESGRVEAMKQLFDKSDDTIKMKSEVEKNVGEAEYFGGLFVLSKVLDNELLKSYAGNVLEVRVSNNRNGRREAVDMNRQVYPEEKKRGFLGRLMNQ